MKGEMNLKVKKLEYLQYFLKNSHFNPKSISITRNFTTGELNSLSKDYIFPLLNLESFSIIKIR